VRLDRLVGQHVEMRTQGGDISLGVCYGDNVLLLSGGGSLSIKQMNSLGMQACQRIISHGGHVSIGGLDGSAVIDSADGDIDLQVLACRLGSQRKHN
jgi:hypothetical protein